MDSKFKTDGFEAKTEDIINEIRNLLDFSTPDKLRERLLETFFAYLIEVDDYPRT